MEKFVHFQNLALYRKKLADPKIGDVERNTLEKLLAEEEARDREASGNKAGH
ncbi:MAG TPA: hypothetical protein VHB49_23860 [Bradyrhizobium sp.]|nr:hypothetical protein [Bradyrhizobium sp.]